MQAQIESYQFPQPKMKEDGGPPTIPLAVLLLPSSPKARTGREGAWFGQQRHSFSNILTGKREEFELRPGGRYLGTGFDRPAQSQAPKSSGKLPDPGVLASSRNIFTEGKSTKGRPRKMEMPILKGTKGVFDTKAPTKSRPTKALDVGVLGSSVNVFDLKPRRRRR
jgi:hypothetical protein